MKKILLLLALLLAVSYSSQKDLPSAADLPTPTGLPSPEEVLITLEKAEKQNQEFFDSLQIQGIALAEDLTENKIFSGDLFKNPFFSSAYKSDAVRSVFFKNGKCERLDRCWFLNENETGFSDFEKNPLAETLKDKVRLATMMVKGENSSFMFSPNWQPRKDAKTGTVRLVQSAAPMEAVGDELKILNSSLDAFFPDLNESGLMNGIKISAFLRQYPPKISREIYEGEEVILCSGQDKGKVNVKYQIRIAPGKNYAAVFCFCEIVGQKQTTLAQKREFVSVGEHWLPSAVYQETRLVYPVGKETIASQIMGKKTFYYDQTVKPDKVRFTQNAVKEYDLRNDAERKAEREKRAEDFTNYVPWLKDQAFQKIDLTDWHIHLRGGMTAEKALIRARKTGVRSGVLENFGKYWPLSSNEKLDAFIANVEKVNANLPKEEKLKIGIQVNDRDWYKVLDPKLRKRLDYILADTMIMDTGSDGMPQKLWLLPKDYKADPVKWMERYMEHNLQILDEPISILAHPTWLPDFIADQYDKLWTKDRMMKIIDKAAEKGIALEIQAESPYPKDRFIELALQKGVKFSFGSNNHDGRLKKTDRWRDVLEKYGKNMKLFSPETSLP
ncbi:MAG: hypothetical protein Q4G69_05380 [Planctomycetia bacterium]|nr:hypothetical protein [Planctomycetia bacterium]